MKDENGKDLTDKEVLKYALDDLGNACCSLYELEDEMYHSLAFMVDSCLKLGTVLINGDNILSASADYTNYEHERYQKFLEEKKKHLKVVK